MAKTMEEEIDGLDLTGNYTGEGAADDTETREPEKPEETKAAEEPENGKEPDPVQPPKEEPAKEGTPKGEPGTGEAGKEPANPFGTKGHTPKGVQERINELSRSNRELKEQNARIMRELEDFKKGLPQPKEKTRDDFATDAEWIHHLAREEAMRIVEQERAKETERAEMASADANFAKTESDARKLIPDYDDVMSREVDIPVDRSSYLYVKNSPMGAMLLYTLKNVDAVRNQLLMTPEAGRIAFLKNVEARLTQIRQEAEKNKGAEVPPNPQEQQPQAPKQEPPKGPALKQPQEVRHPVTGRLNPATCSMDEWMEDGD